MGASRNRVGTAYALTTFAPIIPGHEDELRAYIEGLPMGAESPLARLDTLHLSRLQIFDHLVHQGDKQKPDRLESSYLVFTSSFDGDLDTYLDTICERIPAEADTWWGHCVGLPGNRGPCGVQALHRRAPGSHEPLRVGLPDGDGGQGAREPRAARPARRLRR